MSGCDSNSSLKTVITANAESQFSCTKLMDSLSHASDDDDDDDKTLFQATPNVVVAVFWSSESGIFDSFCCFVCVSDVPDRLREKFVYAKGAASFVRTTSVRTAG